MNTFSTFAFAIALSSLLAILFSLLIALKNKELQLWPPPQKSSWQYHTVWTIFRISIWSSILVSVLQWDSFLMPEWARFGLGLPLFLLGMGIAFYGYFVDLGIKNTQGLKEGLRTGGMYRYSRNPQYSAGIIGFMGAALLVNAWQLLLLCSLLVMLYLLLPFLEEPWLEATYGNAYLRYKQQTPRFLPTPLRRNNGR